MSDGSSPAKLRSIQAFREFEEAGSLSADRTAEDAGNVSALRVLAAVKRHSGGARRAQLAEELTASPAAVEDALLRLIKDGLVAIQPAGEAGEVLVVAT